MKCFRRLQSTMVNAWISVPIEKSLIKLSQIKQEPKIYFIDFKKIEKIKKEIIENRKK